MHGWPDKAKQESEEKLYLQVAIELYCERPTKDTKESTKCGECAIQSVWWPGLSKQIEYLVEKCDECSKLRETKPI